MEIKAFLIKEIISDSKKLEMLQEVLTEFENSFLTKKYQFRKSVIQNDANASNIIVNYHENQWEIGFIDFLDTVETCTVFSISICLAYLMQLSSNPLVIAKALLASYHEEFPLCDEEIQVLPVLIKARLATSTTLCARKLMDEPDNEYLPINEASGWCLLDFLKQLGSENLSSLFTQYCNEK